MSEWLPAATLAIGVLAGFGGQAYTARIDKDRDQRTREDERQAAGDAFQRETLLALQDAVNLLINATYNAYNYQLAEFQRTGKIGREDFPSTLNQPHHEATVNIVRLRQRVRNDSLRERVVKLQGLCMDSVALGVEFENRPEQERRNETIRAFNEAAKYANVFEDDLGKVLREVL